MKFQTDLWNSKEVKKIASSLFRAAKNDAWRRKWKSGFLF